MAIYLLSLVESIRERLDDFGGDRGPPPSGAFAHWQVDDVPCLWKNRELITYIKRTLLDIAGRAPWTTEGTRADRIGSPARLSVIAGNPEVRLHESTLTVEQVRLWSSGALLPKTDSGRLAARYGSDLWPEVTGVPECYLEPVRGLIRLYPIPIANDELRLVVKRRTLDDFEWSDIASEATPAYTLDDVPADLEEALVVGACRYAFLKRDSDAYSLQLAQDFERQLADLVGPPVTWRQKEARRENANLSVAIRGHAYTAKCRWNDY